MTPMHADSRADTARHLGVYSATVVAIEGDPQGRHRIEVAFDWLETTDGGPPTAWATIVTPYADENQGFQMLPSIGSTVVVGFQSGHLDYPFILGSVWNGNAPAPESFTDANDKRLIKSRSGSTIEFDDTDGGVKIEIRTAGGHVVTMDDGGTSVEVKSSSGARIELTAAGGVTVEAAATVDVSAALVTVDAAMSKFSGTVVCDTLIASGGGIVSPMYTPGAGNVW